LPGGEGDAITAMLIYQSPEIYTGNLLVFTQLKCFYVYKIGITEREPNSDELDMEDEETASPKDDLMSKKRTIVECTFDLIKRYPSKHVAHSLIELNYKGGLLTVSFDSLEFWSLVE
jgi:hypothetical protein